MGYRTVRVYLPKSGPVTKDDFAAYAKGDRVQICDVVIEHKPAPVSLRLYLAHATRGPTNLEELPQHPTAIPVLVQERDDELRAVIEPSHDGYSGEVAAAVSVMKAAWAWDEREELPVRVNANVYFAVPRHDKDRRWNVEVRAGAV